jgi:hypothetical protein
VGIVISITSEAAKFVPEGLTIVREIVDMELISGGENAAETD